MGKRLFKNDMMVLAALLRNTGYNDVPKPEKLEAIIKSGETHSLERIFPQFSGNDPTNAYGLAEVRRAVDGWRWISNVGRDKDVDVNAVNKLREKYDTSIELDVEDIAYKGTRGESREINPSCKAIYLRGGGIEPRPHEWVVNVARTLEGKNEDYIVKRLNEVMEEIEQKKGNYWEALEIQQPGIKPLFMYLADLSREMKMPRLAELFGDAVAHYNL